MHTAINLRKYFHRDFLVPPVSIYCDIFKKMFNMGSTMGSYYFLKFKKMKLVKNIVVLMITTIAFFSNAQDGEGLFKSKCNACHMLGKNSTGPNLKGVKQKWIDAEEGDMIYEWVMNPQTLIASGKSQTAMKSKEFSPTDMTPQQVSKEEIDAILEEESKKALKNFTEPLTQSSEPIELFPTEEGEQEDDNDIMGWFASPKDE